MHTKKKDVYIKHLILSFSLQGCAYVALYLTSQSNANDSFKFCNPRLCIIPVLNGYLLTTTSSIQYMEAYSM